MYLYVGNDTLIHTEDILGIFSIQYIKNTKAYKAMYKELEENNSIIDVSEGISKSFILTIENNEKKGYVVRKSVNTILKRLV